MKGQWTSGGGGGRGLLEEFEGVLNHVAPIVAWGVELREIDPEPLLTITGVLTVMPDTRSSSHMFHATVEIPAFLLMPGTIYDAMETMEVIASAVAAHIGRRLGLLVVKEPCLTGVEEEDEADTTATTE